MQINKTQQSPTELTFHIVADDAEINEVKAQVVNELSKSVKLQGFRAGKAPKALVEKSIDQQQLQTQFLDRLLNRLWGEILGKESIRAISQPQVSVTKFVPFSTVEADFVVMIIGDVELPDYKKFRLAKPAVKVEDKDVDNVLENLRTRAAVKNDVERAAKDGDEVTIDFAGVDTKTKEVIAGTDGKDYPLVLGSNSFIPGFEPEVIGLKAGEEKTFTVTFPKDYGAAALQNRKVDFTVTVKKVVELAQPALDDAFAATVGPFKKLDELKSDIKKQLLNEREQQAQRDYESEVLEQLANKTKVAIPTELVDEEIARVEADERQNLTYRGQTWQEHLAEEGVTEAEHKEKQRPAAELRVRAGIVLSEVAEVEGIRVLPDELDVRMQLLKGQYQDANMLAQLETPEARREIGSRMLSEKTIAKLTGYASAKK